MNDYTLAFLLTVLAGLSMLIGSGITVLTKLTNQNSYPSAWDFPQVS